LCISCVTYLFDPAGKIYDLAAKSGLQKYSAVHKNLTLVGFIKRSSIHTNVLHIYIEGDGAPWMYSWMPPKDPTPQSPIALKMAIADSHSHVLYLARPCQLTRGEVKKGCHIKLWTTARFSPEVIDATNAIITRYAKRTGSTKLVLYGYSGGGAIASLVTARREDVIGLMTVAGTLDHEAWTTYHKVSPLTESLNPAQFGNKLSRIPQIHYIGENDKTMPHLVAYSYLSNLSNNHKAQIVNIKDYDHSCCWVKNWSNLLGRYKFHN
jgi:pimeloyl-ACP methyl ester carboxylesterase